MEKKTTVFRILTDNVDRFLADETRPLFIAVLMKDADFVDNLKSLVEAATEFADHDLKVCYALEDLLPYFSERFGIGGTPTFIIVKGGAVAGTLLGKNSGVSIIRFLGERMRLLDSRNAGKKFMNCQGG